MSSRPATHTHTLQTEEYALLLDAIQHWHDSALFSDEQVAQVKDIFKSVLGLPLNTVFVGSALPDAIVGSGREGGSGGRAVFQHEMAETQETQIIRGINTSRIVLENSSEPNPTIPYKESCGSV